MTESAKKLVERSIYVVFFLGAMLAVRACKEGRKPSTPQATVSTEDAERARRQDELRKRMADFDAKQAAGHAARVKRLGGPGAKAQEDRCDAEMMKSFEAAVVGKKIEPSGTPDCDKD